MTIHQTCRGTVTAKKGVRKSLTAVAGQIEKTSLDFVAQTIVEATTPPSIRTLPIQVTENSRCWLRSIGRTSMTVPSMVRMPSRTIHRASDLTATKETQAKALAEKTQIDQSRKGDRRTSEGNPMSRTAKQPEKNRVKAEKPKKAKGRAVFPEILSVADLVNEAKTSSTGRP